MADEVRKLSIESTRLADMSTALIVECIDSITNLQEFIKSNSDTLNAFILTLTGVIGRFKSIHQEFVEVQSQVALANTEIENQGGLINKVTDCNNQLVLIKDEESQLNIVINLVRQVEDLMEDVLKDTENLQSKLNTK